MLSGILATYTPSLKSFPVEAKMESSHSFCALLARLHVNAHNSSSLKESFSGRLVRPFVYSTKREFFMNPCERPIYADLSKVIFNAKELMISSTPVELKPALVQEVSFFPLFFMFLNVFHFRSSKSMFLKQITVPTPKGVEMEI